MASFPSVSQVGEPQPLLAHPFLCRPHSYLLPALAHRRHHSLCRPLHSHNLPALSGARLLVDSPSYSRLCKLKSTEWFTAAFCSHEIRARQFFSKFVCGLSARDGRRSQSGVSGPRSSVAFGRNQFLLKRNIVDACVEAWNCACFYLLQCSGMPRKECTSIDVPEWSVDSSSWESSSWKRLPAQKRKAELKSAYPHSPAQRGSGAPAHTQGQGLRVPMDPDALSLERW